MGILDRFFPSDRTVTINGVRFEVSHSAEAGPTYCVDLLSIPALSAAVEVKAADVSQIPLKVHMRTAQGRQRVRNGLDRRLTGQPNDFENAATFWRTVAMQATLGECFISTRGGQLRILPQGNTARYTTATGEVRYAVTYTGAELRAMGSAQAAGPVVKDDYAWREVLHLWTSQDEHGVPIPLRTRFRHTLGLASDLTRYTTNIYNRGGAVVGYLTTEQKVDADKKTSAIQAFKALFKSSRTATRGADQLMAALDNGWKFQKLDLSPQELMLLETKKDLRLDLCQIAGVPPWKIGDLANYKYATAEAAQREYLLSSLNPLLNQIENEINAKMFLDIEREFLYVEFDRDALVSIDAQTMATIDDLAVKNGTMSLDEYRARRNLPAVPGGAIRQIPVNVTSADFVAQAEALKLEKLRAEIALTMAQAAAAGSPATAVNVTIPAAPPPTPPAGPAPAPEPAGAAPVDYAASLSAIQESATQVIAEGWKDAATVGAVVSSVCAQIADLYGIPGHLENFAARYAAAATKRLAEAQTVNAAYEANRAVNAANHEALRLAHGVNTKVKWVGGANDGQVRAITEAWAGTFRHPPLCEDECRCFLVKHADA